MGEDEFEDHVDRLLFTLIELFGPIRCINESGTGSSSIHTHNSRFMNNLMYLYFYVKLAHIFRKINIFSFM